ncbi:MAG: GIY-YIG nuclease family protein [Acidobacteria bacterium]|nr:GIY-YIG nuclease family protein [Acidobacteriota bacterium]
MGNEGFVYILTNESMPSVIKIGRTQDVEGRVKTLSQSTSVPTPFKVIHQVRVSDCVKVETEVHQILTKQGYRVNKKKEFFHCSTSTAIETLNSICGYPVPQIEIENRNLPEHTSKPLDPFNRVRRSADSPQLKSASESEKATCGLLVVYFLIFSVVASYTVGKLIIAILKTLLSIN